MDPYYFAHELVETYRQEHLKEARLRRLIKEVSAGRPRLRDRLLSASGEFFIEFGQRLKERYGQSAQPRSGRQRALS